ncbi:MAG: type ISP restriction/modification enzyme [Promethearchaeota archaeon]
MYHSNKLTQPHIDSIKKYFKYFLEETNKEIEDEKIKVFLPDMNFIFAFKQLLEDFFPPKLGFSIKVIRDFIPYLKNKSEYNIIFEVLFKEIVISLIYAIKSQLNSDINEILVDPNGNAIKKRMKELFEEYENDVSILITDFTRLYLLEFFIDLVGNKKSINIRISREIIFLKEESRYNWVFLYESLPQLEDLFNSISKDIILNINSIQGMITKLANIGSQLRNYLYSLYQKRKKYGAKNSKDINYLNEISEQEVLMLSYLEDIYEDFKNTIFSDTKENYDNIFSDLITQTIINGFFGAWINYCSKGYEPHTFSAYKVAENLPYESFLRQLFWDLGGKLPPIIQREYISKIEDVFKKTHFNKVIKKKDNLLTMFYSEFLKKYDEKTAKDRGVVYTPSEIVDFIVKGIDFFLENRFKKQGGIINTDPFIKREIERSNTNKYQDITAISRKMQVNFLDPAAGTMTFPCGLLKYAKMKFLQYYKGQEGLAIKAFEEWISNYFFENVYGLEILISPYVLGHLRVQMAIEELLSESNKKIRQENEDDVNRSYKSIKQQKQQKQQKKEIINYLTSNIFKKLKFYLLNTLMNAETLDQYIHNNNIKQELEKGLEVRNKKKIFIVFGNPPYNINTQNNSKWIMEKIKDYKEGLKEKNLKILSDDYVKFIRFAQWKIKKAGVGIVGFITNNNYLDGAVFKKMRQSLMETFNEIYIVNLHGNMRKKEGGNPFGIKVGVAIVFLLRTDESYGKDTINDKNKKETEKYKNCKLYYWDIPSDRVESKFWELSKPFNITNFKQIPITPDLFFIPKNIDEELKYMQFVPINSLFILKPKSGIMSGRDYLVSNPDREKLIENIQLFFNKKFDKLKQLNVNIKDTKSWKIEKALKKSNVEKATKSIIKYNYRGFNELYIIYDNALTEGCRFGYLDHINIDNPAIGVTRSIRSDHFSHALIVKNPPEKCFLAVKDSSYVFLLKQSNQAKGASELRKNNSNERTNNYKNNNYNINLKTLSFLTYKVTPEDVFYYIYAVLYSNIYRKRYNNQLKTHYPRIPFPNFENKNLAKELFEKMSELGKKLAQIHLGISPLIDPSNFSIGKSEDFRIIDPKYDEKSKKIYLNKYDKDVWIANISKEMWDFEIGSIKQIENWLDFRSFKEKIHSSNKTRYKRHKGLERPLNSEEVIELLRLCSIIKLTLDILPEIDEIYRKIDFV